MTPIGATSTTSMVAPSLSAETTGTERQKSVLMLAGGGLSHTSGGVGTLMGYLIGCWEADPTAPPVRVLDTRGEGGAAGGVAAFVMALITVTWECLRGRVVLVHAHMTTRGSVIRKCLLCGTANLLGVPTVIHQHGADFHAYFRQQVRPIRALIRHILNRSSGVVVLGEEWRDFLVKEVGVNRRNVRIIANGVPMIAAAGDRNVTAQSCLNILFLGRLGNRKGVPELLQALRQERVRSRPWHAILAGDGEVERFRQEVEEAGLADRIEIRGWQDRRSTTALLQAAHIMVLPSHHEAMPVAILEALSHSVPVITTPVGVIPEFLNSGEEALLVSPGNVDQLSDALVSLLDNAEMRAAIGASGHKVFLDRLDIDKVAQSLLDLYREAGFLVRNRGISRGQRNAAL